jgi:hypothetical protein
MLAKAGKPDMNWLLIRNMKHMLCKCYQTRHTDPSCPSLHTLYLLRRHCICCYNSKTLFDSIDNMVDSVGTMAKLYLFLYYWIREACAVNGGTYSVILCEVATGNLITHVEGKGLAGTWCNACSVGASNVSVNHCVVCIP